jgi:hypothetical protein
MMILMKLSVYLSLLRVSIQADSVIIGLFVLTLLRFATGSQIVTMGVMKGWVAVRSI